MVAPLSRLSTALLSWSPATCSAARSGQVWRRMGICTRKGRHTHDGATFDGGTDQYSPPTGWAGAIYHSLLERFSNHVHTPTGWTSASSRGRPDATGMLDLCMTKAGWARRVLSCPDWGLVCKGRPSQQTLIRA
ncbi:hypothetical protein M433DRAFT_230935 [Acidomyces richmondensis BFW]|nr:MAG: hypothetical protein FE78DRAFT_388496 [Acidomyces sp. 'richmondensis']KYG49861.1 hypothetical protein M433DRAFT_230935 [Acidomyces richmondensis BFW]